MTHGSIIRKSIDSFKKDQRISAAVLVGSNAQDSNYSASEQSDVDIYLVVRNGERSTVEEFITKQIPTFLPVLFTYHNQWAGRVFILEDLIRLELPIVEVSQLSSVFSRPSVQAAEILFDKTNGLVEGILAKRPATINYEEKWKMTIDDFWYMIVAAVQYFLKGEYWNARHVLEVSLVPNLITLLYLKDKPEVLLLENRKRLEEFLTKKNLQLLKTVSPGYDKKGIKSALEKCIDMFFSTSIEISSQKGYAHNVDISETIKNKLLLQLS